MRMMLAGSWASLARNRVLLMMLTRAWSEPGKRPQLMLMMLAGGLAMDASRQADAHDACSELGHALACS